MRGSLCLGLGDGPGAEEALLRAYAAALGSRDLPVVATVAVTVAGLAALYGRHRDAALVLGAAARLRGAHDRTDPQIRALSRRARTALGDEGFAEAYGAGRDLDAAAALRRTCCAGGADPPWSLTGLRTGDSRTVRSGAPLPEPVRPRPTEVEVGQQDDGHRDQGAHQGQPHPSLGQGGDQGDDDRSGDESQELPVGAEGSHGGDPSARLLGFLVLEGRAHGVLGALPPRLVPGEEPAGEQVENQYAEVDPPLGRVVG
ncbi:hypothetical protein ACIQ64_05215 [Streptomyces sp. NPDC094473]|uniref:hypothetical protein n=1 Tax=unclassified Streptomyces TaxID=2593676 RepID=UPI00382ACD91